MGSKRKIPNHEPLDRSVNRQPKTKKKDLPADRYFNRELSWLEFNQRVLDQAADSRQPLLERLKFLAITGSNLDEFFMVRVGSLKMQAEHNPGATDLTGRNVFEQLKDVAARTKDLHQDQFEILRDQLEPALRSINIQRLDLNACGERQGEAADRFFQDNILPVLSPQIIDPEKPFPLLAGLQVHLCVILKAQDDAQTNGAQTNDAQTNDAHTNGAQTDKSQTNGNELDEASEWDYAVIPLGRVLPRIVSMPADSGYSFVLLEQILADSIDQFFPGRHVIQCAPFRVTRNADVELREDSALDLMAGMGEVLESRKASSVIRLEVDSSAGDMMTQFLSDRLEIQPQDVFRAEGPLDLSFLFQLASLEGFDSHRDPSWPGQGHPEIDPRESMFANIAKSDLLLVHPYERFDPVVRMLEEAANDPDVLAIKQVLYRTSRESPIIAALVKAAERGKYVTVVVELKARFDEARNIEWAKEMEQAGVQVIYGLKGLKTHAKVCIIVRREQQGIVRYMHFGTGNYNEVTARLYSDISLLTSNDELGADASAFFNAITGASQVQRFDALAAAPLGLRNRLLGLIEAEAARCKEGRKGGITAKLNALVDPVIIDALYRASLAGVKIRLNIRGVCCLRPGVPGLSENIQVTSIIDRYLEHARIMHFHQGGEGAMFISSADWMPRNLDRRIELLVPVTDPGCRKKLSQILETYFLDNVVCWELGEDGQYARRQPEAGQAPYRSQQKLYERTLEETASAQMARTASFEPHRANHPVS
jgi:polyphosphate kinase